MQQAHICSRMSISLYHISVKLPGLNNRKIWRTYGSRREVTTVSMSSVVNHIPAAPILIPEGPWKQIPGGVTAAKGFKATGIYGGLRAQGEKPDLALVTCDVDATSAGAFTTNVVAAAPVVYCKKALEKLRTARAVLINAGQANAATGDAGYQDVLDCATSLAEMLHLRQEEILVESTGVIGHRIKKKALLEALPKLVGSLSSTIEGADSAAVAITTTDLVSKSVAIETKVGETCIRVGGMAKGSGMIHPNMATMLGVITTDAVVDSDVWRKIVQLAVSRSFNQITVDGDTSTNDTVIALASGLSGAARISNLNSPEASELQSCLDAVMQGLAKSIAWDGEGATCLIEVSVTGTSEEAEAAKIARSVASSSLVKAAVYGRDPNWGRIACAAGYATIPFNLNKLQISLGDIVLMNNGQPLPFDRAAASKYLRKTGEEHGTVEMHISVGDGPGEGKAWGCDLSYDYVKINAEYTT
ncbi:arginine biosynthesis bifunctional protein ArgJ, chloroplastic isoform X1 [Beta vulgaris subsp. vulgaris]|uniref:arginine biosynthesis bifunctional protein ArgJ, chloroplastic isoform X1 n=2 Tax=Beta vulgaris subsp. vulgaris TaxID=3555 RepID=UPI0020369B94|nr:arginine biosynthesis bifunctional protein ArgJ, chloroplastic isoform X1 [Beta vulgaris subsp. vulgaris]